MNLQVVDQLTELAYMVNEQYDLMVGDMSRAVQRAVEIGDLLSQAKDQVKHGEWEA